MKLLTIFGTRPEAIKLAPLVNLLRQQYGDNAKVCITGQHRDMLDSVIDVFNMQIDHDMDIMTYDQSLTAITCQILEKLGILLNDWLPDRIIVQGDASTAFIGSIAAYYAKIPVTHVEAGLRTYDNYSPWPEEANRHLISVIADMHCAPTEHAKQNLLQEHIPESNIFVTGNTVVDAILAVCQKFDKDRSFAIGYEDRFSYLNPAKKLIFITCHRRESFGQDMENICLAIAEIAKQQYHQVEIVFPVHMNPHVQEPVHHILANKANIHLIEHVDYFTCIYLMRLATVIMTDSGGIQEETPTLGKPTIVMRNKTERIEAVNAGTAILVGTQQQEIINQTLRILTDEMIREKMSQCRHLYGDGTAANKIVELIEQAHLNST